MKTRRQSAVMGRVMLVGALTLLPALTGQAADVQGDLIVPATPPPAAAPAAATNSASVATAPAGTNTWSLDDLTKPTVATDESRRLKDTAGFDKLSAFPFKVTDEMVLGMADAVSTSLDISKQIPDAVKKLNHQAVTVTGFMMPTKVEDGYATEFLLLKNRGLCCYGTQPALNEYVTVRMAGKGIKPVMDRLVTVSGSLRVGEIRENHLLIGIYRMDADKCDIPPE